MKEKEFQLIVSSIEEHLKSNNYKPALQELLFLIEELTPNNLSMHRTFKSIERDVKNGKADEFIKHSIKESLNKLKTKILSRRERISNFLISIIGFTLIPFFPFITKWAYTAEITYTEQVLALAVYCTSISLSINSVSEKLIALVLSVLVSLFVQPGANETIVWFSFFVAIAICSIHITDRFKRHLLNHEPYFK